MRRAALLALALAPLLVGCVRVSWQRESLHAPVTDEQLDALEPGTSLEECLARLGAPLLVRELPAGAFALAYGWLDDQGLGLNVSVPVTDSWSASVDYDRIRRETRGVVLFLDADQRVVVVRRGLLRDLLAELPERPPAFLPAWTVEPDGEEEAGGG